MTHTFINDLTIDTVVNGYYILADIREKVSRTGTPYLLISLKDKSGYISATAFDNPEEITEDARGNAVFVSAEAILFNEKLQLKVKTIRLTTASDYSEFDLADLLEPPSLPLQSVYNELKNYIASIEDDDYRKLCEMILEKYRLEIYTYPAGKTYHHCRCGGLAAHLLGVIEAAQSTQRVHPELNRSLLIAGAFLHDIGKVAEYKTSLYGLFGEKTATGYLLDHIQSGIQIVTKSSVALSIPDEKCEKIVHIIASHHSKSGIEALLPEAFAIADADNMDCEMDRSLNKSRCKWFSATPAA